jgi:O-antigen ligase
VMFWWTIASAISLWIGAVIFPGEGLYRVSSPLPYQIKGVVPVISANSAGSIGAILVVWSLALIVSKNEDMPRPKHAGAILLLGLVTLLFAQYRTGYVAMLFGILLLIAVRKRQAAIWVVVVILVVAGIWGSSFIEAAQPYALRGQPVDRAAGLSGRVGWCSAAVPVWQESPWIGKGLLTATRYEVLVELGRTTTSTIHGTWIEALVGTGVVGIGLLVASLVTLVRRSLVEALRPSGRLLPLLLLGTIFVRSLTGATIEIFGSTALLFLALALSFRDEDVTRPNRRPIGAIGRYG